MGVAGTPKAKIISMKADLFRVQFDAMVGQQFIAQGSPGTAAHNARSA